MADALRRCNETVSYLGVTRRARGVPRSRPRRPSLAQTTSSRRCRKCVSCWVTCGQFQSVPAMWKS